MRPLGLIHLLRDYLGKPLTVEAIEDAVVSVMPERLVPKHALPGPEKYGQFTIQLEQFRDVSQDIVPMMATFWYTNCDLGRRIKPKVNAERYFFMETIGQYYLVVLRNAAGSAVGYFGVQVTRHPLAPVLVGYEDSVYIYPGFRQGSIAARLCRYAEEVACAVGVDQWRLSVVPNSAPEHFAKRKGATLVAHQYTKLFEGCRHHG